VVLFDERGERRWTDQGRVTGQDEHIIVVEQIIVRKCRERYCDRVTSPSGKGLFHEVDLETVWRFFGYDLGDLSTLKADDHDNSIGIYFSEGSEGVDHHRHPTETV
jgi:hypothetical protein